MGMADFQCDPGKGMSLIQTHVAALAAPGSRRVTDGRRPCQEGESARGQGDRPVTRRDKGARRDLQTDTRPGAAPGGDGRGQTRRLDQIVRLGEGGVVDLRLQPVQNEKAGVDGGAVS